MAQDRSPGAAAVLACRSVADPAQQLACFRRASDTLAAETSPPDQTAKPAQEAAAPAPDKKRTFGAPKPRSVKTAKARQEEESLKVKVLSFGDRGDGRTVFHLDDGSTWVETQTDEPVAGSLSVGETVTLKHGLFSGYIMEIPGRSFVRVARMGGE